MRVRLSGAYDDRTRVAHTAIEQSCARRLVEVHRPVPGRLYDDDSECGGRRDGIEDRRIPLDRPEVAGSAHVVLLLNQDHITGPEGLCG